MPEGKHQLEPQEIDPSPHDYLGILLHAIADSPEQYQLPRRMALNLSSVYLAIKLSRSPPKAEFILKLRKKSKTIIMEIYDYWYHNHLIALHTEITYEGHKITPYYILGLIMKKLYACGFDTSAAQLDTMYNYPKKMVSSTVIRKTLS
ncbi:MAG: hypothetical protein COB66_08405 [Coxiella sp. (in: Bacteria)]|nr:MAG: hypothetical protein COB66_08405 [Coxiella sp. (in: g-proteobacteria)]